MAQPAQLPTWASNTNYASGADAGLPTKIEPTSDEKASGFYRGKRAPPRKFNWIVNLICEWIAWLTRPVVATFTFAGGTVADDGYFSPTLALDSGDFSVGTSFGVPYMQVPLPGTYRVDVSLHMTDATATPTIKLINYNAFGGSYNNSVDLLPAQRDTNVYTIKDHAIHSMTGLTTIGGTIALQNVSGHSVSLHSTSRITLTRIGDAL